MSLMRNLGFTALAIFLTPSCVAAQEPDKSGWSMADQYWGKAAMEKAREKVQKSHGSGINTFVQAERLEYRSNEGDPQFLWDGQGWLGGDRNKFWLKSEGEYDFTEGAFEDAEVQALWSHAFSRYFDVQAGVRQDFAPGADRTYAVLGLNGLAPYWFEVDAAFFVSDKGDVFARAEVEYELLFTQRLILQPRAELNIAFQDTLENELAAGLSTLEMGARLRYEIKREFAPYIGISWERALGDTADFSRANGEDPGSLSFVAGIRLWF